MPEFIKKAFANKKIPPSRRILGPVVSAVISFFLPGAAQAINGQTAKGICILLFWYATYSLAQVNEILHVAVRILQYAVMVAVSSDAYFIASRMKLGEEVRAWSILFFDMRAPTGNGTGLHTPDNRCTLIAGASLIDGTGAPPFRADVLLEGSVIRCIRPHIDRKEREYWIVEGEGRILIPGWINPCSCQEATVFCGGEDTCAVQQGITTEILGQHGQSLAPVREDSRTRAAAVFSSVHGKREKETFFSNTGLYLLELERSASLTCFESLIGYDTLRNTVLPAGGSPVRDKDAERVCGRIRSGIESGAKGVSVSLAYPFCAGCSDKELLDAMRTAADCGGAVVIQAPLGEGRLLPAVERVGKLALDSGAQTLLTHVHAFGGDSLLGDLVCSRIADLRERGAEIGLAITGLPSLAAGLAILTPETLWTQDGGLREPRSADEREGLLREIREKLDAVGGPGAVTVAKSEREAWAAGLTLAEAAEQEAIAPEALILRLLGSGGAVSIVIDASDEAFSTRLFKCPFVSVCTDSQNTGLTGFTIPYYLGRCMRQGLLPPEYAVRRNTMEQAARFGLWDRGILREGMRADLVMLRPELLPTKCAETMTRGVSKVWVGGALQYDAEPTLRTDTLPPPKILGIRVGR